MECGNDNDFFASTKDKSETLVKKFDKVMKRAGKNSISEKDIQATQNSIANQNI